ncbi:UNVERIFIED_CONTAM: hypothetical protein Sradi_0228300 [Sesamum radiatum]|uniref:Uncharacterized protein n=1 Tax=Sesamum radiatum TaxID=300843 RepID=A0AAW2VZN2_SESRA
MAQHSPVMPPPSPQPATLLAGLTPPPPFPLVPPPPRTPLPLSPPLPAANIAPSQTRTLPSFFTKN